MPYDDRKKLIGKIEDLREGRRLIAICNFDRIEMPRMGAMSIEFGEDIKEPLYRVLKETIGRKGKLDIFLYTRGGATNAVWPIASLLREFDPNFEVLVPYRAHSSGTLLALAAKRIVMTRIAELSPIDPTTGNQFNPPDPVYDQARLGISVEDVSAYQEFWKKALGVPSNGQISDQDRQLLQQHLHRLATEIHPLALGNVHRVHMQIALLAGKLLEWHYGRGEEIEEKIKKLTTSYYSHHHMINRQEARLIFGKEHVSFAPAKLDHALDQLLRVYENNFDLRHPFVLSSFMENEPERQARFIGGCVESRKWGYLYETKMQIRQFVNPPAGIQIQVPPGETPPLIVGLPRQQNLEITSRSWVRNEKPKGVTT